MHLIDIAGNSVRAGATLVKITIEVEENQRMLKLIISDNGRGMDALMVEKATDPFVTTRTTRKVGLGLPLLKMNAEQTGGGISIKSIPGKGTDVMTWFNFSHVDCIPVGDLPGVIALIMSGNPDVDFLFEIKNDALCFKLSTLDIKDALDGVSIANPAVVKIIREMVDVSLLSTFY